MLIITFSIRWHGRRKYKDGRTWRNRIHNLNAAWESLMDELADAYVKWKYKKDLPDTFDENFSFSIDVVNLLTLEKEAAIQRDEHTKAAVALVYAGYIGTSPEIPSLAISLQTLDTYYTLRLSNPSFSFETFAKIVCDSYSIPYRRGYRTGLSNAFDVYLAIRRKIDIRART
ncbi:hypothetical protein F5879DRAFT_496157 [Lentinula edodes]|nr:hypothetical protein F5879DRAFT_496157 [Lentinula edodes]